MRLGQVAEVSEVGELAADRGRRQVDEVPALQRLRADGHGARRELVHHRTQDCLLSVLHLVSALCTPECQLEYDQGDLVVEVEAAPGRPHAVAAALDEAGLYAL